MVRIRGTLPKMRRRGRKRWRTLTWAGSVVTGSVIVVWIAGLWWYGGLAALPTMCCYTGAGSLRIGWDEPWSLRPVDPKWHPFRRNTLEVSWLFNTTRDVFITGPGTTIVRHAIDIPMWFLVATAGTATLAAWRLSCADTQPGQCPVCGYDRTGLPAGASCPECAAAATPVP